LWQGKATLEIVLDQCPNLLSAQSTLLTAIGKRELPIPDHIDIYHLAHEIEVAFSPRDPAH
jgi:hypothetical protein